MYPHGDEYPLNMPSISSDLYHQRVELAPGLRISHASASTLTDALLDPEISGKFRTQPEYVTRSAMPYPANIQQMIPGQSNYSDPQTAHSWVDWAHTSLDGFNAAPEDSRIPQNPIARYLMDDNLQLSYPRQFPAAPEDPAAFSASKPTSHAAFPLRSVNGDHLHHHPDTVGRSNMRRGSHDRSSDGSHPSSAASSSVHLPPDVSLSQQQIPYQVRLSRAT